MFREGVSLVFLLKICRSSAHFFLFVCGSCGAQGRAWAELNTSLMSGRSTHGRIGSVACSAARAALEEKARATAQARASSKIRAFIQLFHIVRVDRNCVPHAGLTMRH